MSLTVLITGGSGLVGSALTKLLLNKGYEVAHLGRTRTSKKEVKSYIWNIDEGFIEEGAIENANIVVHLAGAGVADKRWTRARKEEILQSRVQSTKLLFSKLTTVGGSCKAFISASAIGIYGLDTGEVWLDENHAKGEGFLAEVTWQWEREVSRLSELKLRVVMLRTGIALSDQGGALPKIANTISLNIGAPLGSGRQYMSWIHIDDLSGIFLKAIEDLSMRGVYNAVAPRPTTNREFTKCLANVLDKKLWLPPVPGFILMLVLGEMAQLVLGGNRVSAKKIETAGYNFKFNKLLPALEALYNK